MSNAELVQRVVSSFFEGQARKEEEALQRKIDELTPVLGEESARIAVHLEHEIQMAPKRKIAEMSAEFLQEKLNAPSPLHQILVVTPLPPKEEP